MNGGPSRPAWRHHGTEKQVTFVPTECQTKHFNKTPPAGVTSTHRGLTTTQKGPVTMADPIVSRRAASWAYARHWPEGRPVNLRYRVEEGTGCHIWTGARQRNGYGVVGTNDHGTFRAHRVAYEQAHGPLADGLQLDHKCRNRACINPEHLEPVSNAENSRRGAKAKLTWDDVREIRRLRAEEGISLRKLGRMFGVSSCAIHNICIGKRWQEESE